MPFDLKDCMGGHRSDCVEGFLMPGLRFLPVEYSKGTDRRRPSVSLRSRTLLMQCNKP